jgi:nitrogenase molybdenum-cofactor synthesis protein NifE
VTNGEIYSIPIFGLDDEISSRKNQVNRKEAMHYCSPSGGGWGVVKVACIVPETEILFAIPIGCGRHGSIASFYDGTADRLSFFIIEEVDIVMGSHIEKIKEAAKELYYERRPKGMILCTTCMDDLLGSDYDGITAELEKELGIPVGRGKMNPILSDTPKDPSLMIQKTIHDFLEKVDKDEKKLNVIGSFENIDRDSELHELFACNGLDPISHVSDFETFGEYKAEMERACGNIVISPLGSVAGKYLEKKIGQKYMPVYSSYRKDEIDKSYEILGSYLSRNFETSEYSKLLQEKILEARIKLRGLSVALGTNGVSRSFDLARFLVELGMDVRYVLARSVIEVDKKNVDWLRVHSPHIKVIPNLEPSIALHGESLDKVDICIGLDVAKIFECKYLVELENSMNHFGYRSSIKLIDKLISKEAFDGDIVKRIYDANLVT